MNKPDKVRWDAVDWSRVNPRRGAGVKVRLPKAQASWKLVARRIEKRMSALKGRRQKDAQADFEALATYEPARTLTVESEVALVRLLRYEEERPAKGLVGYWYAREGPLFTLQVLLASPDCKGMCQGWRTLRRYLSVASDEEFAEVLGEAERHWVETEEEHRLTTLAFLFPQRTEWVEHVLGMSQGWRNWALVSCLAEATQLSNFDANGAGWNWFQTARHYLTDLVVDHGDQATSKLLSFLPELELPADRAGLARILALIESPAVAAFFAKHLKDRDLKGIAREYLRECPEVSVAVLQSVGSKPARELLELLATQQEAVLEDPARVPQLLRQPPSPERLPGCPAKPSKLPKFVSLEALPLIRLRDGTSLPREVLGPLCQWLRYAPESGPFEAIEELLEHCEPHSLARFSWGLAQQWADAGGRAPGKWAALSLRFFPSSSNVRGLAGWVRQWQRDRKLKPVETGLDVLAAIGSNEALMHVATFARKGASSKLREGASARLDQVAQARGLSPEQLADRTAPDLGLDADGRLELDFGGRSFTVHFDEQLKPRLKAQDGTWVARFPRARKTDDAKLFKASSLRWKELCKDVDSAAGSEIARLEQAMCRQRHWSREEFELYFLKHPLLRHLCRRLIWLSESSQGIESFRCCEDDTLADQSDETWEVPDRCEIRLAHPALHSLQEWSEVLADYELLQPFPQVGREVFALDPQQLSRFSGLVVPPRVLLSLNRRGWQLQHDGYSMNRYVKSLQGAAVVLEFEPGLDPYDLSESGEQRIDGLCLSGKANAVEFSEVMRDLMSLRA